jgi:preprotein translocase subunit SecD
MAKLFSARVWILVIAIFFAILAINPAPWAEGIEVRSIKEGSPLAEAGLSPGELVQSVNRDPVVSLSDFKSAVDVLAFVPVNLTIGTNQGNVKYSFLGDLGFVYDENLTISVVQEKSDLKVGMIIENINNVPVSSDKEIQGVLKDLIKKKKFILETNKGEYAVLLSQPAQIEVRSAAKSNLQKGLDLQGGTRVLLRPIAEDGSVVTNQQITDLIDVLNNRLNVYGLADVKIRSASDLANNKFVVVEIAGASRDEVKELIGKQGKFEAKIGDDVVFRGGKGDIPFVCRNDGSCSGIRPPCTQSSGNQWTCTFQFAITLTGEAAKRHADITGKLDINLSASGDYLSKTIDFYLDNQQVDSLQIGSDLKGRETTQIAISGPGFGANEQAAYESAITQMNKLQTILITGSLPLKLEVERMDSISPVLGQKFIKNSFLVGFVAILAVVVVIFIRYRKIKIVLPMLITTISEVVIILGVAAFIRWNLDLAAIAGIIAAVGTGIDDQIVILDEVVKGQQYLNWKEKLKRAFFIIFTAYITTVVAMIPLWNAGAGLIRGFAVTTIIGVTIGVLVTRPAFGAMAEKLLN